MKHHWILNAEISDHSRVLLREAAAYRLACASKVYRSHFHARLLARLGGWLIDSGMRLQARYRPATGRARLSIRVHSRLEPSR